jgi:hypothetical protein
MPNAFPFPPVTCSAFMTTNLALSASCSATCFISTAFVNCTQGIEMQRAWHVVSQRLAARQGKSVEMTSSTYLCTKGQVGDSHILKDNAKVCCTLMQ